MILDFGKFTGLVKSTSLDKAESIDLISLITQLKPELPDTGEELSKLIDNISSYLSEDGRYKIQVHFRESDVYKNNQGGVTFGKYKSLYKVTISKVDGQMKISDVKDFLLTTCNIISEVYPNSISIIKIGEERFDVDSFTYTNDSKNVDSVKLISRIL